MCECDVETDTANVWEGCMDPNVRISSDLQILIFNFRAQIKNHALDLAVVFVENANVKNISEGI